MHVRTHPSRLPHAQHTHAYPCALSVAFMVSAGSGGRGNGGVAAVAGVSTSSFSSRLMRSATPSHASDHSTCPHTHTHTLFTPPPRPTPATTPPAHTHTHTHFSLRHPVPRQRPLHLPTHVRARTHARTHAPNKQATRSIAAAAAAALVLCRRRRRCRASAGPAQLRTARPPAHIEGSVRETGGWVGWGTGRPPSGPTHPAGRPARSGLTARWNRVDGPCAAPPGVEPAGRGGGC